MTSHCLHTQISDDTINFTTASQPDDVSLNHHCNITATWHLILIHNVDFDPQWRLVALQCPRTQSKRNSLLSWYHAFICMINAYKFQYLYVHIHTHIHIHIYICIYIHMIFFTHINIHVFIYTYIHIYIYIYMNIMYTCMYQRRQSAVLCTLYQSSTRLHRDLRHRRIPHSARIR